jgi:hypothetical protein
MDLTSAQSKAITTMVEEWSKDKKSELETTFGERGVVDSTTFLQIAQRIRTKGYEEIPQEDYLNILTPSQVRFTLQGLGIIQTYCKDDAIEKKNFTALMKSRTSVDSTIDLGEYDIRFKTRREEPLSAEDPQVASIVTQWAGQQKAFRLIRRWSFVGKGVRIDMSMVRQTPIDPSSSQFEWSTTFLQRNVLKEAPRYEVEVELLHDTPETATVALALKALIRSVGEVERAIQKNALLIRKTVANAVKRDYATLIGSSKFRGVKPITLQLENITEKVEESITNVRTGFNVTDKADGLRAMGYVDSKGELFLIDQNLNVYRTGLENKACASSLVDGEWVTQNKYKEARNDFLLFDIYYETGGKKVSHLPFYVPPTESSATKEHRHAKMTEWYESWVKGESLTNKTEEKRQKERGEPRNGSYIMILMKSFEFGQAGNETIFTRGCAKILDTTHMYHTDGLILTSNNAPIPEESDVRFDYQFKWKPAIDNTVDFLVKYEHDVEFHTMDKVTTTIDPQNQSTIQYKTMRLYVGSANSLSDINPRSTIMDKLPIIPDNGKEKGYKPALFTPIDFPDTMANTCYVKVEMNADTGEEYAMTSDTQEPISDGSIIEMRYEPTREPGWRWIPSRIRHDKTERLVRAMKKRGTIKYSGMMNDEKVANSVWNSIHEPITESMIRSGKEAPNKEEMDALLSWRQSDTTKKYYERKAPKESFALVSGLRDFHNKYIKNEILLKRALMNGRRKLIDFACGKAGDLNKWVFNGASHVIGIDYAGENITNPTDGAYKRYVEMIQRFRSKRTIPNVVFVMGNSAKNVVNGEAGSNPQEADILRSIFSRVDAEGAVPKYIQSDMTNTFHDGADVAACMFALHYFFENKETLQGFLTNLADTVKVGGLFVGCCFDGDRVFRLLRGVEKDHSVTGTEEDTPIWNITKRYDTPQLTAEDDSLGLAIDVEFVSIGSAHREYLVSFEYLKTKMAEIGFRLLHKQELAEMKLAQSTNTFDASYDMVTKRESLYPMKDSVKQFSFLNRWFIFKREGAALAPEVPLIDLPEVEEDKEEAKEEPAVKESVWDQPPPATKKFEKNAVFLFGATAPDSNLSTLSDIHAGKWIGLAAPFPIPDPEDPTIAYPSIEHYMAGIKLKYASDKPTLAQTLMSTKGKIHQDFVSIRLKETIKDESVRDFQLLGKESDQVAKEMTTSILSSRGVVINESIWSSRKDKFLMEALTYRFRKDERFHTIVEAAKNEHKYLLYQLKEDGGAGELSGVRHGVKKTITGGNKVGRFIMKLAEF